MEGMKGAVGGFAGWRWSSAAALAAACACLAACRTAPAQPGAAVSSLASAPATTPSGPAVAPHVPDDPIVRRGILRRAGRDVVDAAGQAVRWRGVAFGNQVWSAVPVPLAHHDEADYRRVRALGMNAVRFYMHHATFEDAARPGTFREAGWRWLDLNVAWARRHGVYLILNMHVAPGGYQSNADGAALWGVPAHQDRLAALWRAIASRYANEPIVAGYDILNEPCVPASRAEWQVLATRLTRTIREVDPNHIVIVERVNAVAHEWVNDADQNFVVVDDSNVVYTFHFYDPLTYTHQFAPWVQMGEGGRWPDDAKIGRSEYAPWRTAAGADSAALPAGTFPWTRVETKALVRADARAAVGRISLVATRVAGGRVAFDDLTVVERDGRGAGAREVMRIDLAKLGGWKLRAAQGRGRAGVAAEGHDSGGALTVTATTGDAALESLQHEFVLRAGRSYTLSGWVRGEGLPPDAQVLLRLERIATDGPLLGWNKQFLRTQLERYVAWARARDVPLFLGEFGVHRPCFEAGRGGLAWVEDVLDLADEHGLSFTYHDYHGDSFGLYLGGGRVDPARANDALIQLFKRKLAARDGA
jgi:endoglucanase